MLRRLKGMSARYILFCDLVGDFRRSIALSTAILTPLVDRAIDEGMNAHIFAPLASYRFETVDLLN